MAHIKIQLAGDSITYAGPSNNLAPGFRCNLYGQLVAAGVDFEYVGNVNSGDCGMGGSSGLNDGWPGFKLLDLQGVLIPPSAGGANPGSAYRDPDLACIMIGTNDVGGGAGTIDYNFNPPINMTDLIRTLWVAHNETSFAIFQIPPQDPVLRPGVTARVNYYNAQLPLAVARARSLGIDAVLYNPGLTLADISADGVHPNDAGWTKLANCYFGAVIAYYTRTFPVRPNPR